MEEKEERGGEKEDGRRPHLNLCGCLKGARDGEWQREEESGGAGARERGRTRDVGEGAYVAAEGGSERAGWLRSAGKREEWKCKRTDYSRREPRGPRGARILGACAAGVGTRAHVQTVSPLSLSFHSPSPSPRSFPPAFSLAYHRSSSPLSTRV